MVQHLSDLCALQLDPVTVTEYGTAREPLAQCHLLAQRVPTGVLCRGLQVSGFNIRKALAADTPKGADGLRLLLASLGKLVTAGLLAHAFTEYDFVEEWQDAVEHAMDAPGGSRVLLRMSA